MMSNGKRLDTNPKKAWDYIDQLAGDFQSWDHFWSKRDIIHLSTKIKRNNCLILILVNVEFCLD